LQHTPSTQKPDAQPPAALHACPILSLQAPLASQVLAPVHESGSSAFFTAAHAPVPLTLHAWHTPQLAVPQHTPSTHSPEAQAAPLVPHAWPFASLQCPAPSHVEPPVHSGVGAVSCVNCASGVVQVPDEFAHEKQGVVQASAQQVLSTQLPDRHSLAAVQPWPFALRQWPAPSHALVPVHAPAGTVSATPAATGVVQVPAALAHVKHGVAQPSRQQVPSTQLPDRHSLAAAQPCPAAFLQLPVPSHALVPVQAGLPLRSCTPLATGVVHVPVTHE
jgi:hypothetical protein